MVQDGAAHLLKTVDEVTLSRRNAFKLAGAAALLGGGAVAATRGAAQAVVPAFDRLDYVYFLMNIHWLQASYYSVSLTGQYLSADILGQSAGTPTQTRSSGPTKFTDPVFRDFVAELLETELAQLNTLKAIERALDGPGKIADIRNVQAPSMLLNGRDLGGDPYKGIFYPAYGLGQNDYWPRDVEENSLVLLSYIKDIAVTAYQAAVSSVPNDTTFAAFMGIQAYSGAILRDMLYERAQRPGSNLFAILDRLAITRSGRTSRPYDYFPDQGISPVATPTGASSNVIPTDERGCARKRTELQVLLRLVGYGYEKTLFMRTFLGRINLYTFNVE